MMNVTPDYDVPVQICVLENKNHLLSSMAVLLFCWYIQSLCGEFILKIPCYPIW